MCNKNTNSTHSFDFKSIQASGRRVISEPLPGTGPSLSQNPGAQPVKSSGLQNWKSNFLHPFSMFSVLGHCHWLLGGISQHCRSRKKTNNIG